MSDGWQIELLGGLRARHADRVVAQFPTQKAAALLAYLAYSLPRSPAARAELVALLWPEASPEEGSNRLRQTLHRLRLHLEPPGTSSDTLFLADRTTIRLDPERVRTDVAAFQAALQAAAVAGSTEEQEGWLAQAMGLYRGELLPGHFEDWVLQERQWLAERYFQALDQLLGLLTEAGEYERGIEYARRGVSLDPLREESHRALIRLLGRAGRPEAALRQYEELERLLARELDAPPTAGSRELVRPLQEQVAAARQAFSALVAHPLVSAPPQEGAPDAGLSLPRPLTRFFGREEEIARLSELLTGGTPVASAPDPRGAFRSETPRLVTLTGPAGSGKTRLALEVAQGLREGWQGAIWFVPLADLTDPRRLTDRVLEALRVPRSAQVDPLEQAVAVLSLQPSLLLLDNMEHLLPEGAATTEELLQRVEELTVLATSRQRLGVPGEQEFPVAPLPLPNADDPPPAPRCCPSVALFVDRARGVRPDFAVTEGNAPAVEELCRRLEGLPLSLELAAARARVLTVEQMLGRLERRFELLRGGTASIEPRHRSLRAALDSSYQLLAPELQRFFVRLSVFRGGWTLAAAEAVCGEGKPGEDVLAELSELAAQSLVVAEESDGEMRYRLLETLREYGTEQLGPEKGSALALRHAEYYTRLAEEAAPKLYTAAQGKWLQWLEREYDNFRRALEEVVARGGSSNASQATELGLRLAGALGRYWEFKGHRAEGWERSRQLLALPGARGCPAARARALANAAHLAHGLGDFPAARAMAEESLAIYRERGDREGIALSCFELGLAAKSLDEYQTAYSLLQESLAIRRELGNPWLIAVTLFQLGQAARDLNDNTAVRAHLAEALALWQEVGDGQGMLRGLHGVGVQHYLDGDYPMARRLLEEAVRIARRPENRGSLPGMLHFLGEVARCEGDYGRAATLYRESLLLWRQLGNAMNLAGTLLSLGHAELRQGHVTEARHLFQEGLAICRELGSVRDQVIALVGLAGVARATAQPERAARLLGAVEMVCEARAIHLWSADRGEYEQEIAGVRAALSERVLAAAWADGRAMSLQQALAEALSAAPRAGRGETPTRRTRCATTPRPSRVSRVGRTFGAARGAKPARSRHIWRSSERELSSPAGT